MTSGPTGATSAGEPSAGEPSAGATSAGATSAGEQRVAVLSGDRLCVSCGYNLTGQTIVREPHHDLLIVRCPECGTATSIQEYPLLGRWATRWGVILATLWFIFVIASWPASAMFIFGFTVETAERGSSRFGNQIRQTYREAQLAQAAQPAPPVASIGGGGRMPPTTVTGDFDAWWQAQDPGALLADAGGWHEAVDWRALWVWLPAALGSFVIGWYWSMVLLHLERRVLVLWAFAVLALAAVFIAMASWDWLTDSYARPWAAGRAQIGPRLLLMTLAWCAVALIAGMLLGRSLTRGLIRALLSPRFRAPLAVVWTADGLSPPVTRSPASSG